MQKMNIERNDDLSAENPQRGLTENNNMVQAIGKEAADEGFDADIVRRMEVLGYLDYGLDI